MSAGLGRVLVVDDNEDTRNVLATMLEAHGATITTAASVADARAAGIDPPLVHAANSAGALVYDEARLEQHRADQTCNGCHGVIDPYGLALENFTVVGRWQEVDRAAGAPGATAVAHGPAAASRHLARLLRPAADVYRCLLADAREVSPPH